MSNGIMTQLLNCHDDGHIMPNSWLEPSVMLIRRPRWAEVTAMLRLAAVSAAIFGMSGMLGVTSRAQETLPVEQGDYVARDFHFRSAEQRRKLPEGRDGASTTAQVARPSSRST
jgi:hypothetical protein